jgi:hypothetical protein
MHRERLLGFPHRERLLGVPHSGRKNCDEFVGLWARNVELRIENVEVNSGCTPADSPRSRLGFTAGIHRERLLGFPHSGRKNCHEFVGLIEHTLKLFWRREVARGDET